RRRSRGPQHHGPVDRGCESGRHHRRMGRGAARSLRAIPRTDRRRTRGTSGFGRSRRCALRRRARLAEARPPHQVPGWQTRPRRPLQRCRADRGRRPRRRDGGRVPGHPLHPCADHRRRPKILVGKPGLDGHSNGAEQIAVRARDAGMQVVYEGIRLTPEEIVEAARAKKAHVIGLSVLSGSHMPLVEDIVDRMKKEGLDIPVVVGGIIPPEDAEQLEQAGVAAVYTPKDFELNRIMSDVVRIVEAANGATNT
ncbi:MAG: cobalamin B12-binding domain-containing protein, partial [Pseudolabrys sp.]|nr:cobalamin B12-binding domain-containing protein [Pseudolabrys sp.]